MAASTHVFQAPKGTRDFYPAEMAVRRHIETVWREVSVAHGFDEVEGPTFEHLDLYTVKSGPGIVSELFSFRRAGGDTDYALRPEFTPTLARMFAARAGELPRPVKWFSVPSHFRAERPQRGRLREFLQWNVDVIGLDSADADADVIAVTVEVLRRLGLADDAFGVRVSHRQTVASALGRLVDPERISEVMDLLDRRSKMPPEVFAAQAAAVGLDADGIATFDRLAATHLPLAALRAGERPEGLAEDELERLRELADALHERGVLPACALDFSIVRGLAYYTGTVFEVHEASGRERALAGGGRYDQLVELFGGPPTPAVGLAMGDVVLRLVLEDRGCLEAPEHYLPRPHAFIIAAGDEGAADLPGLVADLRRAGLHVRHSYRSTRNVGKLLGEANRSRASHAVILGRELADGLVTLKDLASGEQTELALDALGPALQQAMGDASG